MMALRLLVIGALASTPLAIKNSLVALRTARFHSTTLVQRSSTYGSSKCPCVGFDNVEGETTVTIDGKTTASYPADLGARCSAWDNNRHPHSCLDADQKPGKGKGWCAQQWCYVDPCNCDIPVLPKTSSYLPDATYQGKPVYYSYATCGGEDTWTADNHKASCTNQKTGAECQALDKCAWDGKQCGGKEVMGVCQKKLHGFTWGMASCRCVGIDNQPGSLDVAIGDGAVAYPADTGATCKPWDLKEHPDCTKGGEKPKWCYQAWCYVDPCECGLSTPPKTSSYLPDAVFQGKPVYYSYATCGATDHWTASNHKEACVNQESKEACTGLKKCAWAEGKCLGKDLVEVCHPDEEKKSGAPHGSSSLMAAFLAACVALRLA